MASIIPPRRGGVRARRWLLAPVLACVAAAGSVELAAACSCPVRFGGDDTRERLQQADAAVLGVVTARRAPAMTDPADILDDVELDIRVERAFKAPLGDQVTVRTSSHGGTCGLGSRVGDRVSLFLYGTSGNYSSGLCATADPKRLAQAAQPLPRPRGHGPVRFLLAGGFGEPTVIALDGQGRALAYGGGRGPITHLSVCPGGRRSLETTAVDARRQLYVRDLRSMLVLRRVDVGGEPLAASCRTDDARGLVVLVSRQGPRGEPRSQLRALEGSRARVLHRGTADEGSIAGSYAWLASGTRTRTVTRVDLRTGRAQRIADLDGARALLASPSGRRAAFQAGDRLCVASGPGAVAMRRGGLGILAWADDGRLVARDFRPRPIPTRVLDERLRPVRGLRGLDETVVATGSRGRLYAISDDRLVSVRARSGGVRRLARVTSGGSSLAVVAGATRVSARARQAPVRPAPR